jgi:hypothetical protein
MHVPFFITPSSCQFVFVPSGMVRWMNRPLMQLHRASMTPDNEAAGMNLLLTPQFEAM